MLDRDTLAKIVADCVWVVLAPHDDESITSADWLELAKQIGQDAAEAIFKATEQPQLTDDDVRRWWHTLAAEYSGPIPAFVIALRASETYRKQLVEYGGILPTSDEVASARRIICDALNAGGQP